MSITDLRTWLEELVAAEATIPARVVLERLPAEHTESVATSAGDDDRLLTIDEAAELLAVNKRWIYRRAKTLPFVKRLGTGTLRFSEKGLLAWRARR